MSRNYNKVWIPEKNIDLKKSYIFEGIIQETTKTLNTTIKVYSMNNQDKEFDLKTRENADKLIKLKIKDPKFNIESGTGFVIYSGEEKEGNFINFNMWRKEYGGILWLPQVYFSDNNFKTADKIDISKEGPACIHENDLIFLESLIWRQTSNMKLSHEEKVKYYLNTFPNSLESMLRNIKVEIRQ